MLPSFISGHRLLLEETCIRPLIDDLVAILGTIRPSLETVAALAAHHRILVVVIDVVAHLVLLRSLHHARLIPRVPLAHPPRPRHDPVTPARHHAPPRLAPPHDQAVVVVVVEPVAPVQSVMRSLLLRQ